jgi:hypothetical protein
MNLFMPNDRIKHNHLVCSMSYLKTTRHSDERLPLFGAFPPWYYAVVLLTTTGKSFLEHDQTVLIAKLNCDLDLWLLCVIIM